MLLLCELYASDRCTVECFEDLLNKCTYKKTTTNYNHFLQTRTFHLYPEQSACLSKLYWWPLPIKTKRIAFNATVIGCHSRKWLLKQRFCFILFKNVYTTGSAATVQEMLVMHLGVCCFLIFAVKNCLFRFLPDRFTLVIIGKSKYFFSKQW